VTLAHRAPVHDDGSTHGLVATWRSDRRRTVDRFGHVTR
jgi:hypothetical protein